MNMKTILSLILVIGWMTFIFILSSRDTNTSNKDSSSIVKTFINTYDSVTKANSDTKTKHQDTSFITDLNTIFRKICHAICYLTLSVLVFNVLIHLSRKRLLFYNLLCFVICLIYAILDEYHQTFVVGRTGQFTDVLIDMGGVIIGMFLINVVYQISMKRVHHV